MVNRDVADHELWLEIHASGSGGCEWKAAGCGLYIAEKAILVYFFKKLFFYKKSAGDGENKNRIKEKKDEAV